jgi:predicted hydrocarbon binding protein
MPPSDPTSPAAEFERLFDPRAYRTDPATGIITDPNGARIVDATPELTRALHHILLKEKSGVWRDVLARTGRTCGREIAASLDRESARLGQPVLGELPLETSMGYLERTFATQGLGVLKVDLADAPEHGLVIAYLNHSYFVEVLPDANDFVDAFPAGLLQGFFEHISGEQLACLEIACVRRGAPRCTFVITAHERLAPVAPLLGRQTAEAILARLKS